MKQWKQIAANCAVLAKLISIFNKFNLRFNQLTPLGALYCGLEPDTIDTVNQLISKVIHFKADEKGQASVRPGICKDLDLLKEQYY